MNKLTLNEPAIRINVDIPHCQTWLPNNQYLFLNITLSIQKQLSKKIFRSQLSDEKRLIHDLLEKYERLGKDGRPVKNASEPVVVEFGLGLIKMELHEKENVLALSTWARYVRFI